MGLIKFYTDIQKLLSIKTRANSHFKLVMIDNKNVQERKFLYAGISTSKTLYFSLCKVKENKIHFWAIYIFLVIQMYICQKSKHKLLAQIGPQIYYNQILMQVIVFSFVLSIVIRWCTMMLYTSIVLIRRLEIRLSETPSGFAYFIYYLKEY